MNTQMKLFDASLFTIAILSIISGMLLFELLLFVEQLPAWTNLLGFFAAGVMYKFIELVHKHQQYLARQRVVTIELDFSLFNQEMNRNGYHYCT